MQSFFPQKHLKNYPLTATASISNKPSFGNLATSTQERAGKTSEK